MSRTVRANRIPMRRIVDVRPGSSSRRPGYSFKVRESVLETLSAKRFERPCSLRNPISGGAAGSAVGWSR